MMNDCMHVALTREVLPECLISFIGFAFKERHPTTTFVSGLICRNKGRIIVK